MKFGRAAVFAIALGGAGGYSTSAICAVDCAQLGTLPPFSATIDAAPHAPNEPYTRAILELYRVQLDLYWENSIEGYNVKLKIYSAAIGRTDLSYRKAVKDNECSAKSYEAFRILAQNELQKVGLDYLEPYRQAMNTYREYIAWYKQESGIVRVKEQLGLNENNHVAALIQRIGKPHIGGTAHDADASAVDSAL